MFEEFAILMCKVMPRQRVMVPGKSSDTGKQGVSLELPDLTIAAVAITNGLHFATHNPKDFPMSSLRSYLLPRAGNM